MKTKAITAAGVLTCAIWLIVFNGIALWYGWSHIVLAVFTKLPNISIAEAIGLREIIVMVLPKVQKDTNNESKYTGIAWLLTPLLQLFALWIVQLFI